MSKATSATTAMRIMMSAAVITVALASAANATSVRTFVSGSGNDNNAGTSCSFGSPCRTFAGALAVTQAGGEIVALDSAGFGEVTISHAITITGAERAAISVGASGTGITITANAADLIVLRNVDITGGGAAGSTGVQLNSGLLVMRNCSLSTMATGLAVSSSIADLIDTDILNNTTGVSATGTGVNTNANPLQGPTQVRISRGSVIDNATAFQMNNPGFNSGNSGQANISIFVQLSGNSSVNIETDIVGNATLVTGTGASCANSNCTSFGSYETNGGFNQLN